jgi:hypothetical protein
MHWHFLAAAASFSKPSTSQYSNPELISSNVQIIVKFLKLNSTPCVLHNINDFIRQKGLDFCWMITIPPPTYQRLFLHSPCPDKLRYLTSHLSSRYRTVMSPTAKIKPRTELRIRGDNGKDVDSQEHLWSWREVRPLHIWINDMLLFNQMNYGRAKNPRFVVTEMCMFFTGATTCLHKFRPETAPPTQSRSKLFSSASNSTFTLS